LNIGIANAGAGALARAMHINPWAHDGAIRFVIRTA
jgi:hypothetical protein